MRKINTKTSPEYFRYLLQKTIAIYELSVLTGVNDFTGAIAYINKMDPLVLSAYHLVNSEKQAELHFYCSLAYFGNKDYKKAHKYIHAGIDENRPHTQQAIYKAVRLLNIIIYYELKETDYLEYEIRSYTRYFKRQSSLTKCEKLVFRIIQLRPYANSTAKNTLLNKKITNTIHAIRDDKYEGQLIKFMDFTEWALQKFQRK